jgi:hypothetical protein
MGMGQERNTRHNLLPGPSERLLIDTNNPAMSDFTQFHQPFFSEPTQIAFTTFIAAFASSSTRAAQQAHEHCP